MRTVHMLPILAALPLFLAAQPTNAPSSPDNPTLQIERDLNPRVLASAMSRLRSSIQCRRCEGKGATTARKRTGSRPAGPFRESTWETIEETCTTCDGGKLMNERALRRTLDDFVDKFVHIKDEDETQDRIDAAIETLRTQTEPVMPELTVTTRQWAADAIRSPQAAIGEPIFLVARIHAVAPERVTAKTSAEHTIQINAPRDARVIKNDTALIGGLVAAIEPGLNGLVTIIVQDGFAVAN